MKTYGRNTATVLLFGLRAGLSPVLSLISFFEGEVVEALLYIAFSLYGLMAARRPWRRPYLTVDEAGVSILDMTKRHWSSLLPVLNQPARFIAWREIRSVERKGFSALILVVGQERVEITLESLNRLERDEVRTVITQKVTGSGER